jgi:DNA polymerase-3 subunit alpha
VALGRGPVAYALKITDLDPIERELLFERFLNPTGPCRTDIDFAWKRDSSSTTWPGVAARRRLQIITFGTMAKAVVRDVGRVWAPYGFVDRIAKLSPLNWA